MTQKTIPLPNDRTRKLETGLSRLTAIESNSTDDACRALAHNDGFEPMRSIVTASEAKKIFLAMIGASNEPND